MSTNKCLKNCPGEGEKQSRKRACTVRFCIPENINTGLPKRKIPKDVIDHDCRLCRNSSLDNDGWVLERKATSRQCNKCLVCEQIEKGALYGRGPEPSTSSASRYSITHTQDPFTFFKPKYQCNCMVNADETKRAMMHDNNFIRNSVCKDLAGVFSRIRQSLCLLPDFASVPKKDPITLWHTTSTPCISPIKCIREASQAPQKALHKMDQLLPNVCGKCCFPRQTRSLGTLVPQFSLKRRVNDPVKRYQFYCRKWKSFHSQIPGNNAYYDLRWKIRQKFLDPK